MPGEALVQITTWNVGSTNPSDLIGNLNFFESPIKEDADIHVIGLQEARWRSEKDWVKALSQMGGDKYRFKKSGAINGLVSRSLILVVFVLKTLQTFSFDGATYSTSATAKGGVSINVKAGRYPAFMSFTALHLSAGQKGRESLKLRINDYKEIMEKTRFESGLKLAEHQFSFFFGDLNFRIANISANTAIDMIARSKAIGYKVVMEKLFQNDELTQVRLDKLAFSDFLEQDPTGFPPTYKMIKGTIDQYNPERVPSWTDRILYREKESDSGFKIKQMYYSSIPRALNSDHKPVTGIFKVDLP